jgi:hypothetical protein
MNFTDGVTINKNQLELSTALVIRHPKENSGIH